MTPTHRGRALAIASSRLRGGFEKSARSARGSVMKCPRAPVVLMIEVNDMTRSGWVNRHRLGDHPAERRADHVRPLDLEKVEELRRVVGHVLERVRGVRARSHQRR